MALEKSYAPWQTLPLSYLFPSSERSPSPASRDTVENCSSEGQLGTRRAHYQCRKVAISIPAARKASGLYAMAVISERRLGVGGENLLSGVANSPCLVPRTIVIAILPLLALGAEQASSIQKYLAANAGARPIFVNPKNISRAMLHEIRIGHYTHILVSPELLTGKKFRHLLQDPHFRMFLIALYPQII